MSISSGLKDSPFFIKNGDLFEESAEVTEPAQTEPAKPQEPAQPQKPAKVQEPAKPAKQEPAQPKQEETIQPNPDEGTLEFGEIPDRIKNGNGGGLLRPDPNIEQGPQLDPNDESGWIG